MVWTLLRVVFGVAVLASCTFRESHARCETSADCSNGQECYLRYCVISESRDETATAAEATERAATEATAPREPKPEVIACGTESTQAAEQEGACCMASAGCYDGPDGTLGVGVCEGGVRECVDGKLGVCSDSVVPAEESCENQGTDDDCDGQIDEIEGLGESCTMMSGFGPCGEGRLECVDGMGSPSCVRAGPAVVETCNDQDEDCDGQIDEGFDLSTDAANCGGCGLRCARGELCCGGTCLATSAASESGCPACSTENPCADTAMCCGGACRDLTHDRRHCGACGHSCEQGQRCCDGACKTNSCRASALPLRSIENLNFGVAARHEHEVRDCCDSRPQLHAGADWMIAWPEWSVDKALGRMIPGISGTQSCEFPAQRFSKTDSLTA